MYMYLSIWISFCFKILSLVAITNFHFSTVSPDTVVTLLGSPYLDLSSSGTSIDIVSSCCVELHVQLCLGGLLPGKGVTRAVGIWEPVEPLSFTSDRGFIGTVGLCTAYLNSAGEPSGISSFCAIYGYCEDIGERTRLDTGLVLDLPGGQYSGILQGFVWGWMEIVSTSPEGSELLRSGDCSGFKSSLSKVMPFNWLTEYKSRNSIKLNKVKAPSASTCTGQS